MPNFIPLENFRVYLKDNPGAPSQLIEFIAVDESQIQAISFDSKELKITIHVRGFDNFTAIFKRYDDNTFKDAVSHISKKLNFLPKKITIK